MDMDKWTVKSLRTFLIERGVPCNGKNKGELLDLATKAESVYSPLEPCDKMESERKRRRIELDNGSIVDLNDSKVVWDKNIRRLPNISLADVFAYLTVHCQWSGQRLKHHKQDDGYLMYKSDHVEDLDLGKIEKEERFLYAKAAVKPEQRQSAERYKTWLLCSKTGEIQSAGCGCVAADDGSCKHVVAVLFAIEDYIRRRTDNPTAVGTDEAAYWKKARKSSVPVKVESLNYSHNRDVPPKVGPTVTNYRPILPLTAIENSVMEDKLASLLRRAQPNALLLTSIDPQPLKAGPPSISSLLNGYTSDTSLLDYFVENTSDSDFKYFEQLDQEDGEWLSARKGRITASLAGDVKSMKGSAGKTFINRVLGTNVPVKCSNMEYGKKFEPVAREMYRCQMMHSHTKFCCETTGLHLDKEAPFLGASPDGIVSCMCHEPRVLEIKCSAKHKEVSPADIPSIDGKYPIKINAENNLELKKNTKWFYQVQQQMGILGYKLCDLVLYTKRGIAIIPVKFDKTVWDALKVKAINIFSESIVPSLRN